MFVVFAGLVVVAFMALLFSAMLTCAGVFGAFTSRALGQVQVELLGDGLGLRGGFNLNNHREFLAFWNHLVGDEFVAVLGEGQLGWCGPVAHGDGDSLGCWSHDFARFTEEADLDFLVLGDEELGVRFHRFNDASTVRGFDFLRGIGEGETGNERCDDCDFGFHVFVGLWFQEK